MRRLVWLYGRPRKVHVPCSSVVTYSRYGRLGSSAASWPVPWGRRALLGRAACSGQVKV